MNKDKSRLGNKNYQAEKYHFEENARMAFIVFNVCLVEVNGVSFDGLLKVNYSL
jgi:hypothetical protein